MKQTEDYWCCVNNKATKFNKKKRFVNPQESLLFSFKLPIENFKVYDDAYIRSSKVSIMGQTNTTTHDRWLD